MSPSSCWISGRPPAAFHLLLLLASGALAAAVAAAPAVIVIDPGHGGSADSGSMTARTLSAANNATSPAGLSEKDLTLELARLVVGRIEALAQRRGRADLQVRLTRTDDTNPDFAQRARICADASASCIVSLHFNATSGARKTLGTLAMVSAASRNPNFAADRELALALTGAASAAVRKFLPASSARATISDDHLHGGRGSNFFFQLAKIPALARTPKCFLEVEFLDHPQVQRELLDRRPESFRALADAIAECLVSRVPK